MEELISVLSAGFFIDTLLEFPTGNPVCRDQT